MKLNSFINNFFLFRFTFQNSWKPLIILFGGLILTAAAVFYTERNEAEKEKNEFSLIGNEIKTKISTRLHAHAQLLRTGSALFAASDTVTRKEWETFYESSKVDKNLPGILGLGFSMIIPKEQLQQHIQRIRKEGFPDYIVTPSGDRPVYTSILYLEPFSERNLRAFGYDMFSEPTRRKAMELSRDSNIAMLSGKVILVQETGENVQTGTLMYVPVYRFGMPANTVEQRRAAIKGWVYSPYRMNDLMNGILGRWDFTMQDRIHLQIFDERLSANSLLYDSQRQDTLQHNDKSPFILTLPIEFNEKKWMLAFRKSNEQSSVSSKVIIIVTGGIAISLLLFALSLSLFNTYYRAQRIAVKLTSDLKNSEKRIEILLNSTAEGIYEINTEGRCTFSNTACHQILGYENSGELLGKNMHHLTHHSQLDGSRLGEQNCKIHQSFIKGEKAHVTDEFFWRADGTSFPVEYWSNPIFINGEIEGSVVTFFDITERKLAENKIQAAQLQAENANLAKSKFLSRISHELRTPMNSILGFAQLLNMSELNPANTKGVKHILNSGRHLLDLINEVLDISGIDEGRISLSPEPVQLSGVILEMMDVVTPDAERRNIKTELESSPGNDLFVKADRMRLKQVLLNLINNAVKYNREGGSVLIKTELHQTEPGGIASVRISINDTGLGISPGDLLKLFNPFERIGAEKTKTEGTGLGLTVVKKLMDVMDGRVGVESVPGEGSTFWIELPIA
jgi:PAS domain S-box-containing protein